MASIFWIVIALAIIAMLVSLAARQTRQLLPDIELPPGEEMPRAPVQRLAARSLVAVTVLVVIAAAVIMYYGAETWWTDDAVRLTVTGVLLTALGVLLFFSLRVRALQVRGDGDFDERDGVIMNRACAGVGGAMMTVAAIWMIALTEAYHDTHLVPSYWLTLLFWSLVMTNVVASLAGIVLSYRRG
jgi:peptidoglycan/LPS O-acetylase OafA/YrhL